MLSRRGRPRQQPAGIPEAARRRSRCRQAAPQKRRPRPPRAPARDCRWPRRRQAAQRPARPAALGGGGEVSNVRTRPYVSERLVGGVGTGLRGVENVCTQLPIHKLFSLAPCPAAWPPPTLHGRLPLLRVRERAQRAALQHRLGHGPAAQDHETVLQAGRMGVEGRARGSARTSVRGAAGCQRVRRSGSCEARPGRPRPARTCCWCRALCRSACCSFMAALASAMWRMFWAQEGGEGAGFRGRGRASGGSARGVGHSERGHRNQGGRTRARNTQRRRRLRAVESSKRLRRFWGERWARPVARRIQVISSGARKLYKSDVFNQLVRHPRCVSSCSESFHASGRARPRPWAAATRLAGRCPTQ
jgi:hypothetical protein